jgi:predicted ATPase/class 3 adenylate cyclase
VAEAERRAQRGQIVLSPAAQALYTDHPVTSQPSAPCRPELTDEVLDALCGHVSGIVTYKLRAGQADWLAEIRRLSILFLGLSGLDYQAGDALGQVQRWLSACQELVQRYGGSLNKLLVDDKGTIGLILFGAPPRSHLDDALRATRCALDLSQVAQAQGLKLAIGLTTGPVFAGPVGSASRREYTVMGDAVNLAARLMYLAKPAGIRSDHATYYATREKINWQTLPPETVKGKVAPVRLYQPLSIQRETHAIGEGSSLIGRTQEMASFAQLLEQCATGQLRLLFIEGDIGIGKSRLVTAMVRRVRERGWVELLGSGDAWEQQTPYKAWREVFQSFFQLEGTDDLASQNQQVIARLTAIAPHLLERAPLLNDLLGLTLPETDLTIHLEPRLRQASLTSLLIELLTRWASEQPLLLVLENAQWLDSLSWQLVIEITRSLSGLPVLLLVALRPLQELSAEHPYHVARDLPQTERLALAPLSPSETVQLAAARLGLTELGTKIAKFVVQRAAGNPLVTEELALNLRDQGIISVAEGHALLTGHLHKLEVPETLHGLVLSGLDRLPPQEQLTLKAASVIGRIFGYVTLRDVFLPHARLDEPQLQSSLGDLFLKDILRLLNPPTPLRSHSFRQAITQEVTYSTLLQTQRRDLHERAARWYERYAGEDPSELYPLLAYHWRQAQAPERELHYAVLAAQELSANYANSEALSFLDEALALTDDATLRHELLWLRLELHDRLGDRRAQQEDLVQLQALADRQDDAREQVRVANAWADYYRDVSDYPAAVEKLQAARSVARQVQDVAGEARSLTLWGQILEYQGAYQEAKSYFEQALERFRDLDDHHGQADNLSRLSNVHRYLGDKHTARANAREALNIRRAIGDQAGEATSLINLGILSLELGEIKAAETYWRRGLRISQKIGDRAGEAFALSNIGHGHLVRGDFAAALDHLQQALRLYRAMGEPMREANCLDVLGVVWRDVGDEEQARRCFQQALDIQLSVGDHSYAAYTYLNLGLVRLAQDSAATHECYQKALRLARETGTRDAEAYALSYQAALQVHIGDLPAATRLYQQALTLRRELHADAAAIEDQAGLARIALAQENLQEARRYAQACLDYIDRSGVEGIEFPMQVYLTCYDVLRASGESRAARRVLGSAYDLLQTRLSAISDPALRESMRENVATNRRAISEWERMASMGEL